MTNVTIALETELREATQELTAYGSKIKFHPDNIEVSRKMQDRVVMLKRMIKTIEKEKQ